MTMTKKRLLLIASVPLTIAVTLGVLAMLPPSPGVTKANFDRIQDGMTRAEVEQILGGKGKMGGVKLWRFWEGNDGSEAGIAFIDDCVTEKRWTIYNETILDKIRRWLHLR
jgi:hypothetical protein